MMTGLRLSTLLLLSVFFSHMATAAPTVQLTGPSGLISPSSASPFAGTASFPDAPPLFRDYGGVVIDVVGHGTVGSVSAKKANSVNLSQSAPFKPYIFPSGSYTLRAKATSWNGSVSISTTSITIDNMPSVNVITPLAKQARPVNRSLFTGTVNFKGGCYSSTQCGFVEIDVFNASKQKIWWARKRSKSSTFDLASINAPTYQWGLGKYSYEIRATAPYGKIYGADTTITTGAFEFINPLPTISLTLDKPSITACEVETGTITVTSNDPTPNGGTVTLTLPNGSTASTSFAGKTATLTFADFGLPNGYSGTHAPNDVLTFTADVTTAAGHSASAQATANVIAGGLNVTITPEKTMIEPKLQARSDAPVQIESAYSSPVKVYVTDNANQPLSGANVLLNIETIDSVFAGHNHANTLSLLKPTGVLTSSSGLTTNGIFNTTFQSSEFSSIERIKVIASYQGCSGTGVSSNINTQLSGFVNLTINSPHVKIGGTAAHEGPDGYNRPVTPDNNHWVSSNALPSITRLLELYSTKYAAGLYINDISLPKGGRFDEQGDWSGKHQTHRRGIDIDMHITDTGLEPDLVESRLNALNDIAGGKLFFKAVRESSPNHVHIQFHPN